MSTNKDAPAPEIVVIRRRGGGDDEGHHGGVWKIAYADFMTAMMAFFLVMWLVNASNEEIKSSVASYFNPLKLTDEAPMSRGVEQVEEESGKSGAPGTTSIEPYSKSLEGKISGAQGGAKEAARAAPTIEDPFEGVETEPRASGKVGPGPDSKGQEASSKQASATVPGAALIDPFNPLEPLVNPEALRPTVQPRSETDIAELDPASLTVDRVVERLDVPEPGEEAATARALGRAGVTEGELKTGAPSDKETETDAEKPELSEAARKALEEEKRAEEERKKAALMEEARELAANIRKAVGAYDSEEGPLVRVGVIKGELVIQLTDSARAGMFALGSAEPDGRLTELLQKLVPVIKARTENVVIKGHTDAIPYRSTDFDNWRLSLARAETAYVLLRRFGLELGKVDRIEAHGSRNLKRPEEPSAAVNRRIEIVLRRPVG